MLLYPAAMSDPDLNPNFRRMWFERPPPKRTRPALPGSSNRAQTVVKQPQNKSPLAPRKMPFGDEHRHSVRVTASRAPGA